MKTNTEQRRTNNEYIRAKNRLNSKITTIKKREERTINTEEERIQNTKHNNTEEHAQTCDIIKKEYRQTTTY